MACGNKVSSCVDAKTQNDIADFLMQLIEWIRKLAELFDSLNAPATQAANPCIAEYAEGVRQDAIDAVQAMIEAQPERLTALFECMRGTGVQTVDGKVQFSLDTATLINCGISAVVTYVQTRDIAKSVIQFVSCVIASGGGGNGDTPDPTPVEADPVGKAKKRC